MSDPKVTEEKVVTPTEEEQEAVTGGAVGNTQRGGRSPLEVDPQRINRPIPAPWRPGPPPESF